MVAVNIKTQIVQTSAQLAPDILSVFSSNFSGQSGDESFTKLLGTAAKGENPEPVQSDNSRPQPKERPEIKRADNANSDYETKPKIFKEKNTNHSNRVEVEEKPEQVDAVNNLNVATKELKEAINALEDSLKDKNISGDDVLALLEGLAGALQNLLVAVKQFEQVSPESQALNRFSGILQKASSLLESLQQLVGGLQVSPGEIEGAKAEFSEMFSALQDGDVEPGDVEGVIKALQVKISELATNISAVKNFTVEIPRQDGVVQEDSQVTQVTKQTADSKENVVEQSQQVYGSAKTNLEKDEPRIVVDVKSSEKPEAANSRQIQTNNNSPQAIAGQNSSGKQGFGEQQGKQFGSQNNAQISNQVVGAASATQQKQNISFESQLQNLGKPGVVEQIKLEMKTAVKDGVSRIVVRLDPAELGEVEIKMEIGASGKTGVVISVDRPQTLELLQKDAKQLQQILSGLGLNTDSSDLSFNLRGGDQQNSQSQYKPSKYSPLSDEFDEEIAVVATTHKTINLRYGVNIKV